MLDLMFFSAFGTTVWYLVEMAWLARRLRVGGASVDGRPVSGVFGNPADQAQMLRVLFGRGIVEPRLPFVAAITRARVAFGLSTAIYIVFVLVYVYYARQG